MLSYLKETDLSLNSLECNISRNHRSAVRTVEGRSRSSNFAFILCALNKHGVLNAVSVHCAVQCCE
jgi:hypothetical protein